MQLSRTHRCPRGELELVFIIGQLPRSFPSMVFVGNGLLESYSSGSRSCSTRSFAFSIRVQSCTVSLSIHRVSRHETCLRHTSTALFPLGCGSLCLVLLLCMAPGRACTTAAAVHRCLRSCHDGALFPWPSPCWPWPVFVLEVPMPLQVGPVFGLGLRWQRPGCSWLHGPRPSSLP
jgi:hypothetical protein